MGKSQLVERDHRHVQAAHQQHGRRYQCHLRNGKVGSAAPGDDYPDAFSQPGCYTDYSGQIRSNAGKYPFWGTFGEVLYPPSPACV